MDFKNKIILAPMAGINDLAFRLLCRKYGAEITYSQMLDVSEIDRYDMRDFHESDRPIAIQLIGNIKDDWERAIKKIESYADFIDINFGCPDKEKLERRSGSYLLNHSDQIVKIIKEVKKHTNKPITAKIRSGWNLVNAVDISKALEKEGVYAIAIHPRIAKQGYKGKADWTVIKKIKDSINIPIIGNGDITLPGHAKAMLEQTKCDAIMVGRCAITNPFIFQEIKNLIEFGKSSNINISKKNIFYDYLEIYDKYVKEENLNLIKDHACWFFSGLKNSKEIKEEIRSADNKEKMLKIIESIKE